MNGNRSADGMSLLLRKPAAAIAEPHFRELHCSGRELRKVIVSGIVGRGLGLDRLDFVDARGHGHGLALRLPAGTSLSQVRTAPRHRADPPTNPAHRIPLTR